VNLGGEREIYDRRQVVIIYVLCPQYIRYRRQASCSPLEAQFSTPNYLKCRPTPLNHPPIGIHSILGDIISSLQMP
jgi:hypothetical protein